MRGCVLIGVWGAGKTTVCRRVVDLLNADGCESLISIPQAATITTHMYMPGSTEDRAAAILSWIDLLATFLEDLDGRFRSSSLPTHRFSPRWTPTCVLEGLGFDVPVYGLPIDRDEVMKVERRLAALGIRLVLLRVSPERIRSQCIESTRMRRGPKWSMFLQGFGPDDQARATHILSVQNELVRWAETSPLPLEIIDVDEEWELHAREVARLITA